MKKISCYFGNRIHSIFELVSSKASMPDLGDGIFADISHNLKEKLLL